MTTAAMIAILLGLLMIYAGVKGLSLQRLLVGDNQTQTENQSLGTP